MVAHIELLVSDFPSANCLCLKNNKWNEKSNDIKIRLCHFDHNMVDPLEIKGLKRI
jgi:hypothetical protein